MFNLPKSTEVKKVIPKIAFDAYTNSRQKKVFTDEILRMVWMNKLSTHTTNLPFKEVQEIQIFDIELKHQVQIKDALTIIDKAIPYPIIFIVRFENRVYLSTSPKHQNPNNEDNAVIDYTFLTEWFDKGDFNYVIELRTSLDGVYKSFCEQFTKNNSSSKGINDLVSNQKQLDSLNQKIKRMKLSINSCKQFNKKVDLNIELNALEIELERFNVSFKRLE
ncbi:MAG: DUF4391 domain-containing protein [Pelobium sp.]